MAYPYDIPRVAGFRSVLGKGKAPGSDQESLNATDGSFLGLFAILNPVLPSFVHHSLAGGSYVEALAQSPSERVRGGDIGSMRW
jgi:hypothetical protein